MPNLKDNDWYREKYQTEYQRNKLESINESLLTSDSEYLTYLKGEYTVDLALLFIDISNFSTIHEKLDGKSLSKYFDMYYDLVIPCIYDNKGVVEKIIGDGIICIFGQPFLEKDISHCIYYAFQCAKDIIKKTAGTAFQSKIALHAGEVSYFHNKSGHYEEFTVVGKPLTDLFRLEGISEDNCINYFDNSIVRNFFKLAPKEIGYWEEGKPAWSHMGKEIVPPKGTTYKQVFRIIKATQCQ